MTNINISNPKITPIQSTSTKQTFNTASTPKTLISTSEFGDVDTLNTLTSSGKPAIHFMFVSDNHSRMNTLDKFISIANHEKPDLIIDGGDFVHDGTESEFQRAYSKRNELTSPVHMVNGNHDAELRGPFSQPLPEIPDFQSFTQNGVHFVLLDNENEHLTPLQFEKLEAELKANKNQPTVVAMHVPVLLSKEGLLVKMSKHLPLNFASPVMEDPVEIKKFTDLMEQYGVKAVLAGHTHIGDEVEKNGVRYVTSGSSGGLTPGPGIQTEYLDLKISDGELKIERKALEKPSKNPFMFLGNAHEFYRELNQFNHDEQGWNFVPSVNIEYQTGIKHTISKRGEGYALTASVGAERILGNGAAFARTTLSAGSSEALGQLSLGYKHAILGDYNKGVFAAGSVGANGGFLHGKASAGVGAKASIGAAYKNWTFELGQEYNTNFKASTFSMGYRF